jgi:hypothetical protein
LPSHFSNKEIYETKASERVISESIATMKSAARKVALRPRQKGGVAKFLWLWMSEHVLPFPLQELVAYYFRQSNAEEPPACLTDVILLEHEAAGVPSFANGAGQEN